MKTSKEQIEYAKRYRQKNRLYSFRLHKEKDAELIKAIESIKDVSFNSLLKHALIEFLEKNRL